MAIGTLPEHPVAVFPAGFEMAGNEAGRSPQPQLRAGLAILPFALALVIGILTLPAGSFSDEGEILLIAARMAEGEQLYRDVFTHHFPLPYILVSLLFGLTGRSLPAARLALVVLTVATFALLGRRADRRAAAGLACLAWMIVAPFSAANLVIYPVFSALALLLVFVLGRDLLEPGAADAQSKGPGKDIPLGLAITAAGLTDPLAIYPVGTLAIALLLRGCRPRRASLVALLTAAGLLAGLSVFGAASGGLDDFWRDTVLFNRDVYLTYRPDTSMFRLGTMMDEIRSGLGLGDPRFWQEGPQRPLRLAQIDNFDAWLFTGAFFRWALLAAVMLALLAGRPLGAGYTLAFSAALLAMSDHGFRSLPLQALAFWLAAEQVVALPDVDGLASRGQSGQGGSASWNGLRQVLQARANSVATGSALLLGGWLIFHAAASLWRMRDSLHWQPNIGAYQSKAEELRRLASLGDGSRLAWYPYEPYIDFFAALPPLGRYPNLLPWTAEWGDAAVAEEIQQAVSGERPALVGFDAARWFWIESFDTGSRAPQTWQKLQEACSQIDVDLFACGMPDLSPRLFVDPKIPADLPLPELQAGSLAKQDFAADCAGLSQLSVRLATYARFNSASIELALRERDSGREIARLVLKGWELLDNGWQVLELPRQPTSRGRDYVIELSSVDGAPGNALTAWRSEDDRYPGGELQVGGQPESGDLVFAYACSNPGMP